MELEPFQNNLCAGLGRAEWTRRTVGKVGIARFFPLCKICFARARVCFLPRDRKAYLIAGQNRRPCVMRPVRQPLSVMF